MALTSNETAWATTTVQLIISCAFGALIAWITFKAQHAKSMEEIQRAVKNIIVRLIFWASNLFAGGLLILEFISPLPITRKDVFVIVWCVAIMFLTIIYKLIQMMMRFSSMFGKQLNLINSQRDHTGRIINILEEHVATDKHPKPRKKRLTT